MNTATAIDLADIVDAIESLAKNLAKLPLKAKVDVAARLKAVVKTASAIDEAVKVDIKAALKGKEGVVPGELFKAAMALIPTTRLNQKALEVDYPKVYAKYLETKEQSRITFETR